MSYKLKTLIVFDTNALRSMEGNEVSYSSFSFGKPYNTIDKFIKDNKLEDDIKLAVSTMVIAELKNQKARAYKKDIQALKEITNRLSGLPHVDAGSITVPDEDFDCATHIEQQAQNYIDANGINTLIHKDEDAPSMLKNMLSKVVGIDKPKSPFAISSKHYNDAGFKDSVIWETIMHYENIKEFDKVIFLSKDGDYQQNCIEDFRNKWNKHISIEKEETSVIATIQKDYDNYIKERTIHDYAQTEYFKEYLRAELIEKTTITINNEDYKIENYTITDICKKVDRILNELDIENIFISSEIRIYYTDGKGDKKEQTVEVFTILEDDETKQIISTEFDFELK